MKLCYLFSSISHISMLLIWNAHIGVLRQVKRRDINHMYFVDSNPRAYSLMFVVFFWKWTFSDFIQTGWKLSSQVIHTVVLIWFWHNYFSLHPPTFVLNKYLCANARIELNACDVMVYLVFVQTLKKRLTYVN